VAKWPEARRNNDATEHIKDCGAGVRRPGFWEMHHCVMGLVARPFRESVTIRASRLFRAQPEGIPSTHRIETTAA
jgi:hypothetical protein